MSVKDIIDALSGITDDEVRFLYGLEKVAAAAKRLHDADAPEVSTEEWDTAWEGLCRELAALEDE